MKGLYKQIHFDKEIVVIDYSMIPRGDEFKLMKYSLSVISQYEKTSALVLEIISSVKLSHEILEYFPSYFEAIKGHVKRWASVGFGEMIFKEMVNSKLIPSKEAKNKNIDWFETKEEALGFLIGDSHPGV